MPLSDDQRSWDISQVMASCKHVPGKRKTSDLWCLLDVPGKSRVTINAAMQGRQKVTKASRN